MIKTIFVQHAAQARRFMKTVSRFVLLVAFGSSLQIVAVNAVAEEISKEQIKGLDEQVQEIKSDVLAIAAELNRLEERLLYPSNTQVAVFVSLQADDGFLLDGLELYLNGEAVTSHLYSYKELEALRKGGVQRIFTGNLSVGQHEIEVTMLGRTKGGNDLSHSERFRIEKSVGPKAVEISLAGPGLAGEPIVMKEL